MGKAICVFTTRRWRTVLLIHDYIRNDGIASALAAMAQNPEIQNRADQGVELSGHPEITVDAFMMDPPSIFMESAEGRLYEQVFIRRDFLIAVRDLAFHARLPEGHTPLVFLGARRAGTPRHSCSTGKAWCPTSGSSFTAPMTAPATSCAASPRTSRRL